MEETDVRKKLKKTAQITVQEAPAGELAASPAMPESVFDALEGERAVEKMMGLFQRKPLAPNERLLLYIEGATLKAKIITIKEENGKQFLQEKVIMDDLTELIKARRYASKITRKLQPTLREQISDVVKTALSRKPLATLKAVWRKLNKKHKAKIVNRLGCIFLEIDDETIQI